MTCETCKTKCIKKGFYEFVQKYYCKSCRKYQRKDYKYQLKIWRYDGDIKSLLKECMSINSISRYLKLAKTTVRRRIYIIGEAIAIPFLSEKNNTYEMDEMQVLIGNKALSQKMYLSYAINRSTKSVPGFIIGPRTKAVISKITEKLLSLQGRKIYTDGLNIYPSLIPSCIHKCFRYRTNKIERNNLALRNSLKRLSRKTICFSKNTVMLEACLKIYFWG